MDLDHFKSVNDTHGHAVGDEVLAEFGRRLQRGSRRGELVARTGGEEFALVLPDTSPEELAGAAERLRATLDGEPIETDAGPLPVTASIGAAWTRSVSAGVEKLLYETADAALYDSKGNGRNQVTMKPMA
jgi:diguanylate cyclase (GGDEF)-like protein